MIGGGTLGKKKFWGAWMTVVNGMDTYAYPENQRIDWLGTHGHFRVICFYLQHTHQEPDPSWSSTARSYLATNGWGFFPTYGGLQAGNSTLSPTSGAHDGQDAVSKAQAAGFTSGSVIYLDVEEGGAPASDYLNYIRAWVGKVRELNFMPAIYGPYSVTAWAKRLTLIIWSAHVPAGTQGQGYDPDNLPSAKIDPGCIATQYRQAVTLNGLIIPPAIDKEGLDLSLCLVADPSNPAVVLHALNTAGGSG